jgi:hypothetical protein
MTESTKPEGMSDEEWEREKRYANRHTRSMTDEEYERHKRANEAPKGGS